MAAPEARRNVTPSRVLGAPEDPALESDVAGTPTSPPSQSRPPRMSFASRPHRPSRGARWRALSDEEIASPAAERPAIPSALKPSGEIFSTPLPVLPMIVLSIVMLGEFLSANVSTPFLLFMVEGFGVFHDESDVGYWTGILVSCFFVTQFLTSLLWATAAEKHGVRTVLFVSLLGSSLTCFAFGTATSLPQAMCIRLLQGVFAGAIGVGRGNVVTITDPTNEGRAYAILGFCWGFGGVAGAIIGGSFERPADKWPDVFSRVPLFVKFPYILPTSIAAAITGAGALLTLFLSRDGGPREGAIRLPPEKDNADDAISEVASLPSPTDEEPRSAIKNFQNRVSKKVSGYFARRVHEAHEAGSPTVPGSGTSPVPLSRRLSGGKARAFSKTSRANGSAYGYGSSYRNRLASNASHNLAGRRGSLASTIGRRRTSIRGGVPASADVAATQAEEGGELNFAQRIMMANEFAVNNIADLWVAAAMNVENEDVFLSDEDLEGEEGEDVEDLFDYDEDYDDSTQTPSRPSRSTAPRALGASGRHSSSATKRPSTSGLRPSVGSPHVPPRRPSESHGSSPALARRGSTTFPAIFSHTGVRTPPAVSEHLAHPLVEYESALDASPGERLEPIFESRPMSTHITPKKQQPQPQTAASDERLATISEKRPSMLSQLPIAVIIQYGLLALHSTTHDQVFLSYLVSKYQSGGLNLNAGHFAQLIALMSLASIAYQFYLYPNMGPPRGRFSHLSMFRIGSLLFIPAYLSVTLYRPFANATDEGSIFLMAALALSTALRYAGITFAYTAIAILLNYMSPPHILGYANGIAQTIVSFARFVGPVLGGYLWSVSVDGNPSGYPLGFIICSCVTLLAVAHSFFIR